MIQIEMSICGCAVGNLLCENCVKFPNPSGQISFQWPHENAQSKLLETN